MLDKPTLENPTQLNTEMRFVKDTLTLKEFTSFDRDAIII